MPTEHPSHSPVPARADRLQACVIRVLEAISAGAPLTTLLELIALGVEEVIPSAMASILLVTDDGLHLKHGAAPSLPRDYIRAIDGAAIGPAAGSCGTAVYRRELIVVSDIEHDPYWVNYWALALSHGLRACWSTPVMDASGKVLAAYAVYHRQPQSPHPEDLELLERMAHLVRIAIERDQQDRQLQFSERRLRAIFTCVATGIICTAPRGELLHANPAFCAMVGYTEHELLALELPSLIHPDERARYGQLLGELTAGKRAAFAVEHRYLTKSGSIAWARTSVTAFRTVDGELEAILAATDDITERVRQEAVLRESEERFRLLSWATNDAIWDWDLLADTLWWSQAFEKLFGFRRDEVEPTIESWTKRIHPDDQERVVSGIRRAITEGRTRWSDEYRFVRHDGSFAQVHDRGTVIHDADGKPVRMVGGIADITQRLALEEQLRRSQQLESLGQLTGGVAHDFNNLLTVILGNADLLVEDLAADAEHLLLAETIASAAQRGADLTQRLLAFARRQPLDPRVVDVNRLVAGMDGLLRRTLGEHIEIEMVRAAGLWQALVDPAQLDSALLNLCLNARDAMPAGGRLTIETANMRLDAEYAARHIDVTPGQYVMLAVSDTGAGISPEHLGRVFEPFFTTKQQGKGTGLGLAMVFGFSKQTGGHVNVYSEPGQGTTVRLYLPRSIHAQAEPATTYSAVTAVGGGETVLLVEDEDLVRRFARDQLLALGYRVIEAANGPLALDVMRVRADIDLLFTDMIMPGGMSGRDLAQAARTLRPGLRVLYASGYTESAIVHHGRLDPGVHLLTKPYRRPDLARKIREALS